MEKLHYVYFLKSQKDGSYHIGVTSNIEIRLKEHNIGLSKSTAPKRPWILVRIEKLY
jgi:putative endonuclease